MHTLAVISTIINISLTLLSFLIFRAAGDKVFKIAAAIIACAIVLSTCLIWWF